ncbi:hypothetical protein GGF32_000724 [Allomyces javanicus]|nr:hypothetical protein GGF32_000724 [Allomyces javanicus]
MTLVNAQQNLSQLSRIEALPTVVQNVTLGYLATCDRPSLIRLARASPAFFANAIRTAIRTAPANWTWLTVDPATQRPAVCRGDSSLVGSLGACFKPGSSPLETAVYLVPAVCQYWTSTNLHIGQNIVSSFVLKALPHVRRIAWCLQDMDVVKSRALVDEIERAGGIPAAVTKFDVRVLDAKSWAGSDVRADESTIRLHFFPVDRDVPVIDRRALAVNVLPRLRNIPNLTDLSLCEWGAVATDKAVYSALTVVPNLQRLDLAKNRCITRRVVPFLLRLIKRGKIIRRDTTDVGRD